MTEIYNIGPRVKAAIEQSGLKPAEIALRAGMTWAQLYRVVKGQRPHVSAETVRRLSRALGVSTDYLLGMDLPAEVVESELRPAGRAQELR